MKKIKNKLILIFMCITMMLGLSACTSQTYTVKINNDDTVNMAIEISLDMDTYKTLGSFGVDLNKLEESKADTGTYIDNINALFQETAAYLNSYGYEIKSLDDAIQVGIKAEKTYKNLDEFNAEIKQIYEDGNSGFNLEIMKTETMTKTEYKAYGTLSYYLDPDSNLTDEKIKAYFDEQYDSSGMVANVYIYMPTSTKVSATDGDSSTGIAGAIHWQAKYDKSETPVHAISQYTDTTLYYIIAVVAIVVIVIVVFFVLRTMKIKKERASSSLNEERYSED